MVVAKSSDKNITFIKKLTLDYFYQLTTTLNNL